MDRGTKHKTLKTMDERMKEEKGKERKRNDDCLPVKYMN